MFKHSISNLLEDISLGNSENDKRKENHQTAYKPSKKICRPYEIKSHKKAETETKETIQSAPPLPQQAELKWQVQSPGTICIPRIISWNANKKADAKDISN